MAANIGGGGGGPPSFTAGDYNPPMERQLIFQYNNHNSNKAGISIAERRAATCGFNASNINVTRLKATAIADPVVSCFTIPPGISPSTLLDSPIMLPNAQAAQPSPTTGTFEFPSPKHDSLNPKLDHAAIASKHEPPEDVVHSAPAANIPFEGFEYLQETSNIKDCFEDVTLVTKTDHEVSGNKSEELPQCFSLQPPTNSNHTNQILSHCHHGAAKRQISTHPNQEKHRKSSTAHFRKEVDNYCDDGFYWRKYGQKHVKGSEYPRSYYRCTNMNCPVKKKVERSHDGQITEIVYWGSHNHPAPRPLKRLTENSEMTSTEGSPSCFITHDGNDFASSSDWKPTDCLDGTASTSFMTCISCETHVEAQFSSAFGSQDGDGRNEASPESISLNNEDDENGESSELRKRKRESIPIETTALRSTREPRVVIQIESKNDILDDGYRWRKYGQKVVKGNPNPRSYYKCTTPGCLVRKHITRAADDIRSVVTTYEGKHNHELPASKNASLVTNVPPAVTNNTVSTPSTMARKLDVQNVGKQVQDLPLYLDRKPLFSYNELMRSNLPGNFASDMNFGASSVYPLSFPPFQSLPPYGSLLMNNNHLNNYPSSNLYPMFSDYMSLPSQINHVHGSANASPLGGNFHFNNYAGFQTGQKMEIRERHADILKPKEEQRDDSELYIYDT